MEFKIGDKVKMEGVVVSVDDDVVYGLRIDCNGATYAFTKRGRAFTPFGEIVLELVERPKRLVKKWRWVYTVDCNLQITDGFYANEEEFTSALGGDFALIQKIDSTETEAEE